MQKHHTSGAPCDASASARQSRRNFLFATAGVAASLPAIALAGTDEQQINERPELSIEEQLDAAIEGLKAVLIRMHPAYDRIDAAYLPIQGSGGMVIVDIKASGNGVCVPKRDWGSTYPEAAR